MARKSKNKRRSTSKKRTARSARPAKARRVTRKPRVKARRKPAKARRQKAKASRPAKRAQRRPTAARRTAKPQPRPKSRRPRPTERPALDRTRRVLPEAERLDLDSAAARTAAGQDRMMSAARSGHDELKQELGRQTANSPTLTAGDVDAKWQDAYAVGDESPGGDNPTPDQDRVDDIGKALGIQYQDDQELQGGDEVTERDRHRWELDPASSDDWPHDKDKD